MRQVGTVRLTLEVDCADVRYSVTREYSTVDGRVEEDVKSMLTAGAEVIQKKCEELPNAKV